MFSFDTRLEVTDAGLSHVNRGRRLGRTRTAGYIPTEKGIRAAASLLEARAAILTPSVAALPFCATCLNDGILSSGIGSDYRTKPCPDCNRFYVCECGELAAVTAWGRRFCQSCVDFMERQEAEARNFSDGRGDRCR